MGKQVQINLNPSAAADETVIKKIAASLAGIDQSAVSSVRVIKRSVDARKKNIRVNLTVEVFSGEDSTSPEINPFIPIDVSLKKEVIIVGAGPAGLFAALRLIELGLRPVIIERGRDVSSRKKDIARISSEQIVDSDSNYCFGEGGAGTYSDGKLYTLSLIHISEPTRLGMISYAVFCLKKKKKTRQSKIAIASTKKIQNKTQNIEKQN